MLPTKINSPFKPGRMENTAGTVPNLDQNGQKLFLTLPKKNGNEKPESAKPKAKLSAKGVASGATTKLTELAL